MTKRDYDEYDERLANLGATPKATMSSRSAPSAPSAIQCHHTTAASSVTAPTIKASCMVWSITPYAPHQPQYGAYAYATPQSTSYWNDAAATFTTTTSTKRRPLPRKAASSSSGQELE